MMNTKDVQRQEEEFAPFSPCIYFLTQKHLYAAAFRWVNFRDQKGRDLPRAEWPLEFISPLLEVPLLGEDIFHMIDNLSEGRDILFIPEQYAATGHLGRPSRANPLRGDLDIRKIVLIRPSHTPKTIEELMQTYGFTWFEQSSNQHWFHQQGPPPSPSREVQRTDQGEPLFDLYVVNSVFRLISPNDLFVRLTYAQALQRAQSHVEGEQNSMILRYGEEDASLQWINAGYTDVGATPGSGYKP